MLAVILMAELVAVRRDAMCSLTKNSAGIDETMRDLNLHNTTGRLANWSVRSWNQCSNQLDNVMDMHSRRSQDEAVGQVFTTRRAKSPKHPVPVVSPLRWQMARHQQKDIENSWKTSGGKTQPNGYTWLCQIERQLLGILERNFYVWFMGGSSWLEQ